MSHRSNVLTLCPEAYIKECYEEEKFEPALLSAKSKLQANLLEDKEYLSSHNYPNIIFLGTGSCIPNKTRNTSGILLNIRLVKIVF